MRFLSHRQKTKTLEKLLDYLSYFFLFYIETGTILFNNIEHLSNERERALGYDFTKKGYWENKIKDIQKKIIDTPTD